MYMYVYIYIDTYSIIGLFFIHSTYIEYQLNDNGDVEISTVFSTTFRPSTPFRNAFHQGRGGCMMAWAGGQMVCLKIVYPYTQWFC